MTGRGRAATAALSAALAASGVYAVSRRRPELQARFDRTNHAGRTVTLLEGPALASGAAVGAAFAGPAGPLAVLGAAGLGALDDHAGDTRSKGLRGHLGALARGEVTTGAVKILGLGITGVAAVALARSRSDGAGATSSRVHGLVGLMLDGALVAGAANLINLLDLRPGRALKATVLLAAPLVAGRGPGAVGAAAAIGAAAGVIRPDLAGEAMLGDTGANAAGALVGLAAVQTLARPARLVALGALIGLTLASERMSFTRIIESTPGLRELDRWGRGHG